ncbi:serine/threonine protein kinase [Sorangium sp. So ce131]|uniref:serine/threonine protein kinase n=1 Tax=Sorangium sp. So ce131 TaxID=3133282 RepID=UPI003F63CAAC
MCPLPALPEGLPKEGDTVAGKYRVEGMLGAGGMGFVVSAVHVALRQRVAVKFLSPTAEQVLPDAGARFLREARFAMAIQSEHVTRVLDVGTLDGGLLYIVMERLSGVDLSQLLRSRGEPIPAADAAGMVLQACEAIAEAHSLGIVHRDLKLTNLFVTSYADGSPLVKVLDFGLSKLIAPDLGGALESSLTVTSVIVGSPHYMSPEQIRSLKHVDTRTDIWALGVILYQLVSGRRPFRGSSLPSICMSIAADAPRPIRSFRPEVPAELDQLILRCLEKDVNRRVQTVAELAEGLAPFAPQQAVVSLGRLLKLRPSYPGLPAPSSRPTPPPPSVLPEPPTVPSGIWASVLGGQEHGGFLPWLQSFDAFVRGAGAQLGLDEGHVAAVADARAGLESAALRVDDAEALAGEAERTVARVDAEVVEAERRCAGAQAALDAALEARPKVLADVLGVVGPIAEQLRRHDRIPAALLRQMGLLPAGAPRSSEPSGAESGRPPARAAPPPASAGPASSAPASSQAPPALEPPRRLFVLVQPNRTNVLEWLSGNEPGTSYVVEAAVGKLYRGAPVDPEPSAYKPIATVTDQTTYRHVVGAVPPGVRVKYRIRAGHGSLLSGYSAEVTVACK